MDRTAYRNQFWWTNKHCKLASAGILRIRWKKKFQANSMLYSQLMWVGLCFNFFFGQGVFPWKYFSKHSTTHGTRKTLMIYDYECKWWMVSVSHVWWKKKLSYLAFELFDFWFYIWSFSMLFHLTIKHIFCPKNGCVWGCLWWAYHW